MKNIRNSFIWIVLIVLSKITMASVSFNLELISHLEDVTQFNSNGNYGVSDVWGYTDETGVEYAIIGYRYGTFIYDVSSDPESSYLVYEIPGPSGGDSYYHRDFKTIGDYLYIVNEMYGLDEGLQIIDLSPLPESSPIKLSTYSGIAQSHNIWIDEELELAFTQGPYPNNIHIADVSNPIFPIEVGSFSGNDGINCHDIYTVNNFAYISEGWSHQYGIYDISDLNDPVRLATIPTYGYAHNAWVNTAGTHLITTEETAGMTIKIWDIQDLDNINLAGEYLGENNLAHNVHVKDDFVYISHYTTGLKIIDIFDPSDPIEVAAFDTYPQNDFEGYYGCWGAYPFTENGYVYASDMQNGLYILDHGNIEAGWVSGYIHELDTTTPFIELRSTLNDKSYYSDETGYYHFGFSQGDHEFEIWENGVYLETQIITIYPHQSTEHPIFIGGNSLGDVNGDGGINILDVVVLVNLILNDQFYSLGDINGDGQLNILDVVQLINLILV